ncbi:hypothetical protein KKF32_02785 [Patescibacteria group bacterium]|nr:hypothetical protein [Patescibacteria group bacterium]
MNKKIVSLRNQICQKENIKVLKIFDTNEHELTKDVILGKWQNKKVVLRVGEHRLDNFFPQGYLGKNFIIPEVYLINHQENYEIEEYLPGKLFCNLLAKPKYNKLIINDQWLKRLIKAHWEFQKIVESKHLPIKYQKKDKILKFYGYAKKSISSTERIVVEKIINGKQYNFFWQKIYPCKWKYSHDNLLAMPKSKVGLIDLAGVGRRVWGYDLGWLFWPQWFNFSKSDYLKFKEHFEYLQKFFNLVYVHAPVKEKKQPKLFYQKCHLVLLERIIGAMYDLNAKISHTRKVKSGQKSMMMKFLKGLLTLTLAKIN